MRRYNEHGIAFAVIGWIFLNEQLTLKVYLGIVLIDCHAPVTAVCRSTAQ